MAFSFCVGPANLDLELEGYAHTTQALAKAFCEGFPVRTDQDWWHARLVAGLGASSHRGGKTLALGPVTDQGTLVYPELSGQPLRHARRAPFYMASWAYPPIFCAGVEIVWRTLRALSTRLRRAGCARTVESGQVNTDRCARRGWLGDEAIAVIR